MGRLSDLEQRPRHLLTVEVDLEGLNQDERDLLNLRLVHGHPVSIKVSIVIGFGGGQQFK